MSRVGFASLRARQPFSTSTNQSACSIPTMNNGGVESPSSASTSSAFTHGTKLNPAAANHTSQLLNRHRRHASSISHSSTTSFLNATTASSSSNADLAFIGGAVPPSGNSTTSSGSRRRWPLRATAVMLRGPSLLLRAPTRLLLRAPSGAVKGLQRARMVATPVVIGGQKRLFATTRGLRRVQPSSGNGINGSANHSNKTFNASEGNAGLGADQQQSKGGFTSRLRRRWSSTPTKWYPIPISLGAAVLVALTFYKNQRDGVYDNSEVDSEGRPRRRGPVPESQIKVQGPWQVHVIGALPLRSISRLYGLLNSYQLPVWFRTPGYKLYAFVFGVNLDECEPSDLREYRSMSEFFMRRLKDGVRPIAETQLVSPADGKVVNFGVVEGGRVEQVKGSTYSLDALLSGTGPAGSASTGKLSKRPYVAPEHPHKADPVTVNEEEFAKINDISYSLEELVGNRPTGPGSSPSFTTEDASLSTKEQALMPPSGPKRSFSTDAKVGMEVNSPSSTGSSSGSLFDGKGLSAKEGNKLFFAVVYLAPGDYHRYHSPTNWIVEKRRHFAGELFSVSPWMASKLQDLFVLNERVALLGRWRHGFFSMTPVGATNVGSIRVNFDSTLRTNSPLRPITPGTFSEATYAKASTLLGGQPLRKGDEIGGFWLGSTIVLVFEAPESFEFNIERGQKVKMGQALGDIPTTE